MQQQEQKGRHSIVGTPAASTSNSRDVNSSLATPATAGPIAKVLKTEIERIHVQRKDTSGQPAADNSSNEESTTGTQAIAGMPATAKGKQQKRPPQLLSFRANSRKNRLKSQQKTCLVSRL